MNTLKAMIVSLFGSYIPTSYTNADGIDIIPSGMAGLDFEWLAGFVLFCLTFYCIMRLLGGILSDIFRK